jgi:uncharacterized protein (DUF2147 family)
LIIVLFGIQTEAQVADQILGVWWNPEKTSRTRVFKKNGTYYGKIIWLKDNYNQDGTYPRRDLFNENPSHRERTLLGSLVMEGLKWDANDNEWKSGSIYDPRKGKTYSIYAKLNNDSALCLYAYAFGIPFLHKELICERYYPDE